MSIYPNPEKDLLNIEVKEKSQIKIVNLLGATLATQYLYTGNNTVNVSHLPKGVYFIQTENGSGMKFIKE